MDAVRITRARADAVEGLRGLWLELHRHHRAVGGAALGPYVDDERSWGERRAMYARALAEPHGSFLLVAERTGAPVGYAMVAVAPVEETWVADTWRTGPLVAELETLVVTEAARGRGIGGRLLDAVEAELATAGIADVLVGALAANAAALRLYERRGFRPAWTYLTRFGGTT